MAEGGKTKRAHMTPPDNAEAPMEDDEPPVDKDYEKSEVDELLDTLRHDMVTSVSTKVHGDARRPFPQGR